MTTATATRISLALGCDHASCAEFAGPLLHQLSNGYERCSVLPLPEYLLDWRVRHRTARKRSDRCKRLGYDFAEIAREEHEDDIYAINTSLDERQGRAMTRAYREPVHFMPLPEYPCSRHRISTYGVLSGRRLVAYLWLYRAGDLALVSSILGHGDYLDDGVMHLLIQGAVAREIHQGGFMVYNRHDSGQDGLRQFKGWFGFEQTEVEWAA